MITLKAVLVTASDELRAELEPLSDFKLVAACASLDTSGYIADPDVAMRHTLMSFARRWLELHDEIKVHTRHLKTLTTHASGASARWPGGPRSPHQHHRGQPNGGPALRDPKA